MMNAEPDQDGALVLIKRLSNSELNELVNDDDKLSDLIKDLPHIKNLSSEKEMLLAANKSLAESNVTFEHKLSMGKQELISKYEELASVQEQIKIIKQQIDSSSPKQTPEAALVLIKKAAREKDEETEKMVEDFLNKEEPTVDEFMEAFVSGRCLAHQRRIKGDKAKELVNATKNRSESQSSLFQLPPITTPWATPYPTHLPNMPIPNYPMP